MELCEQACVCAQRVVTPAPHVAHKVSMKGRELKTGAVKSKTGVATKLAATPVY